MTRPRSARRRLAVFLALPLCAVARAQCINAVTQIPATAANGSVSEFTDFFGSSMLFGGWQPGPTGASLWQWDPVNGAHVLAGGTQPEYPTAGTTPFGPRVFFSGRASSSGRELHATDGTAAGTVRVKDIWPGSGDSFPQKFCAVGDRMFFQANDGVHGDELWVSDGTTAGTYMVLDIWPGAGNSRPSDLCALDGVVLFSAFDTTWDRELWRSDGTAAGTYRVLDILPGPVSGDPFLLTRAGDHVYFHGTTNGLGAELWKTDGTAAGTVLVKDLNPGSFSGSPVEFCACGDRVFFIAKPDPLQRGLFVSDGTAAGTMFLGVQATGTLLTGAIRCSGDRVYFMGQSGSTTGNELYVSDGTLAGTQLVADLVPGTSGSNPQQITPAGNGVFFASTNTPASRLWFTDGTAAGTVPICMPATGYSLHDLTMCRGQLFFHSYKAGFGEEMFTVATPGASTTILGPSGRPGFARLTMQDGAVPVLGTSVDIVGDGPSGQFSVLLGSEILPPLPAPVVPGFLDGGTDWVGIQFGLAIQLAVYATPDTSWTFVIGNDPTMEGMLFRFQTLWWDPVGPTPFQLSNGLQLAIGTGTPH